MQRLITLMLAIFLAACGGGSATPDPGPDPEPVADCGNGSVDPGEICDGGTLACPSLGATWSGGNAVCRADCRGWNATTCPRASPTDFETVKPAERDARWETARCNDGTPFAFVVRLASPATDNWVVHLQGGVMCDDYSFACNERDPPLTTTLPAPDRTLGSIQFGGLMSRSTSVNPDFANANQVLAQYCSSDFWSGATTQRRPSSGDPSRGWHFSGHANVDAMIQLLSERYGLDDSRPGLRVLFGGSSAGAFGAHFNAARVADELPAAASSGRLLLLVDAGWMTAWDDPAHRLGNATTSDRDVWSRARDFWAATFDPNCEAREADKVNCFFGPGWYPHVSTEMPTFVQQSPTDFSFMGVHGIASSESSTVAAWRAQVSASLLPVTWLFSGNQFYHTLGLQDAGMDFGPAGSTFGETLGRFWAGEPRERVVF